jgi:hypothetical protein
MNTENQLFEMLEKAYKKRTKIYRFMLIIASLFISFLDLNILIFKLKSLINPTINDFIPISLAILGTLIMFWLIRDYLFRKNQWISLKIKEFIEEKNGQN